MGKVIDKSDPKRRNLQIKDKSGRGKGNFAKVTGDPDWDLTDWDAPDFDLSPQN